MIGFYVPILFLFLGCKFVHTLSSYVCRVACHGLLLMDNDPEAIGITKEDDFTTQKDGGTVKVEFEISKTFNKHKISIAKTACWMSIGRQRPRPTTMPWA
jgi:hypothetical protein